MKYPPPACIQCGAPRGSGDNIATPPHARGKCAQCRQGRTYQSWRTELAVVTRMQPCRTPLQREPALWEAFAPDRAYTTQCALPRVRPCVDCGRQTRPHKSRAADLPGTIPRHSHGRCSACAARERRVS